VKVCAIKGDNHTIVRDGLLALLDENVDVEVVDQAVDGLEMARMDIEFKPEVDGYERVPEQEREILILVAEGCTAQQTLEISHPSPRTVDGHPISLMPNLDFHGRTEAVRYALRRRLTELWLG
jgi:DNA-binding NarL/FixJ family response regulator